LDELAFSRFCSAIPKKNQQKEKRLNSFIDLDAKERDAQQKYHYSSVDKFNPIAFPFNPSNSHY
jgi:hypothetical protein